MIGSLPSLALGGIQSGLNAAASAAEDLVSNGPAGEDRVTLSGEEPRDTAQAVVDLRLARYQVAANAAVLRTYDELQGVWAELGAPLEG